ncbi:coil containing protein [Vibrio phage 1.077.O._10N.261.45.A10]|nr:coil containing protein [Vibrio phage 1.070.O._10N.261.45.B2]AUR85589.1 coil containing protein [Vibrio phage 1.077.O._10N.261.45.A10]
MQVEVIEAAFAGLGVLVTIIGGVWKYTQAQRVAREELEQRMVLAVEQLDNRMDELSEKSVTSEEMKEYVQLFTAPIVLGLDNLAEESRRTRKLMEKLYDRDHK